MKKETPPPPPLPALAVLADAGRWHLLTDLACDSSSLTLTLSVSLLLHPRHRAYATLAEKGTLSCGQGPQVTWVKLALPSRGDIFTVHSVSVGSTSSPPPWPASARSDDTKHPLKPEWHTFLCLSVPILSSTGSQAVTSEMLALTSGFSMTGNYGYICP